MRFVLLEKGRYRYSDPKKTALDLAYLDSWRLRSGDPEAQGWVGNVERKDARVLRRYPRALPDGVRASIESVL